MNKTVFARLIIVFIASFYSALMNSQQVSDSLMHYLEIVAKNNPTILQKLNEYQAALQKVPQVGSLPDPELSMGVFLNPMELVSGNQVADIRLMQMFPWFGVLKHAKDEMSLMAKAKYESFRDARLQVYYDVQRTWYELYKIQKDILISEKNIDILHAIERLFLVKFRAGPIGITGTSPVQAPSPMQSNSMVSRADGSGLVDLYRIQIEIGELENTIGSLRNQQNTLVARFNTYLNRPVQSVVAITDDLKSDTLTVFLSSVSDSMLTNNPMLGMLQFEQNSLEARKKMVTRMGYPMLGFGVNYSLINKSEISASSMNGKDMIMPMVTLSLPIYRKKYKAMQSETEMLKTVTVQNYSATANTLQTEYYQAVQLYQDARRRMKLYSNQYILANKTLDIMMKSFSTSGASLTDILRIRQQIFDYEFKQVEAVVDYNTGIAWLNRLMAFSQTE